MCLSVLMLTPRYSLASVILTLYLFHISALRPVRDFLQQAHTFAFEYPARKHSASDFKVGVAVRAFVAVIRVPREPISVKVEDDSRFPLDGLSAVVTVRQWLAHVIVSFLFFPQVRILFLRLRIHDKVVNNHKYPRDNEYPSRL